MSEDNRIMLGNNYLKRNYVKEYDLRFTYLPVRPLVFIQIGACGRFMLDTALKILFNRIRTIAKLVN